MSQTNDNDNNMINERQITTVFSGESLASDTTTHISNVRLPSRDLSNTLLSRAQSEGNVIMEEFHDDTFVSHFAAGVGKRYESILVILFCILWPFGVSSFAKFQEKTDSTFHPIPGSLSSQAQDAFQRLYAHDDWLDPANQPIYLLLQSTNTSLIRPYSPGYHLAKNLTLQLEKALPAYFCPEVDTADSVVALMSDSNSTSDTCTNKTTVRITSYYSLIQQDLRWMAKSMTANNGMMQIVQVQYNIPDLDISYHRKKAIIFGFIDYIENAVTQIQKAQDSLQYYNVSMTGLDLFQRDMTMSAKRDVMRMDLLVLPIALVLLGIVLPKANPLYVWIIPLVSVISTVCCWSIVMRFVAEYIQITQFVPNIMMSLTLGMGIDYTLFLLSRYLEDPEHNKHQAVLYMITKGGHVLLLSGITLMLTFLGLCFLPLALLRAVGIGASVSIASSLFINLTIVPALLYTPIGTLIIATSANTTHPQDIDTPESLETSYDASSALLESSQYSGRQSFWHVLSRWLLHRYKGVLILFAVLQLLIPVAWFSKNIKSSLDFDLFIPAKSAALQNYNHLANNVGSGRLNPYRILFDGSRTNTSVISDQGFDAMHTLVQELMSFDSTASEIIATRCMEGMTTQNYNTDAISLYHNSSDCITSAVRSSLIQRHKTLYNGISVVNNIVVPHSIFVSAKMCGKFHSYCRFELLRELDQLDNIVTRNSGYTTFVSATLGVDPMSDEGIAWLNFARDTVAKLQEQGSLNDIDVYIVGTPAIAKDSVDAVYHMFPTMVITTTVIVVTLLGVFFRSILAPIRSLLSIGLTITFSFGMSVFVYQHDIFHWTQLRALVSLEDNEICWMVPIMSFSILVGLALDYDVFLITRIIEYREQGYEHKSSISAGLHSTGNIITAAGIIMALSFGSLMLSDNPALYQWSFVITTGVLLDTFVIRTVVVPIIMGLSGPTCWWPRTFTESTICFAEFRKPPVDDVGDLLQALENTSEYESLVFAADEEDEEQ